MYDDKRVNKMSRSKSTLSDDQINLLEAHLAGTLRPVIPPNDVIQRLRERVRFPQREAIVLRLRDWQQMFFVLGGVMSGMLVLITIARALYYLVGRKQI